jgi:hypothetical protein
MPNFRSNNVESLGSPSSILHHVCLYNYVYIIICVCVCVCAKCTDYLGLAGNVHGLNTPLDVHRIAR